MTENTRTTPFTAADKLAWIDAAEKQQTGREFYGPGDIDFQQHLDLLFGTAAAQFAELVAIGTEHELSENDDTLYAWMAENEVFETLNRWLLDLAKR